MQTTVQMLLIVCPLVFIAGFVDSIAGGGGLISLPAYIFTGMPMHNAIATNKLSATFGGIVAMARFVKSGNVHWKSAGISVFAALTGSFIGTKLVLMVDEKYLKYILLILLPIIAIFVLTRKSFGHSDTSERWSKTQLLTLSASSSFIIGGYDGFFGPGTGTFLILVYTGVIGLSLTKASGNAKVINASSNVASLFAFLLSGKAIILLGLIAAIFNIAGSWLGSGFAIKNGSKVIKPVFVLVLCLLFAKIGFDMFF